MDLYHEQKPGGPLHRNASYTEAEYEAEFGAFVEAFEREGGLPRGMIQGCVYATDRGDWGSRFGELVERWSGHMSAVSLHRYATTTCGGKVSTAAELLSDAKSSGTVDAYRRHIRAAIDAGVPFVIGEGNTASCGGQAGVSDTMAAAIWSLDFLPTLSKAGCRRMNFHGGPGGAYPPISFLENGTLQTRPLYYGLFMFSELVANHSRWLQTNVSGKGLPPSPSPSADSLCKEGILGAGACCEKQCGSCGGPSCGHKPGGSKGCCEGAILAANASCDEHLAPCVVSRSAATSSIVAHATSTRTGMKVLVARKTAGEDMVVEVCGKFSQAQKAGRQSAIKAELLRLSGSEGLETTATNGKIELAGQSLAGSTDGEWKGTRAPEIVTSRPGGREWQLCFDVSIGSYSAVLLVMGR